MMKNPFKKICSAIIYYKTNNDGRSFSYVYETIWLWQSNRNHARRMITGKLQQLNRDNPHSLAVTNIQIL